MNWDTVQGQWKQFTGKVKTQWGKLTDNDLTIINGKRDQLVGKIQEKYGYAKDKAEEAVAEFEKTCEACDAADAASAPRTVSAK